MALEPFKGLRPFNEEDAEYFCGRDEDVEAVMNMLMVQRLTILHGVAGVGKTSFLWAGVAHAMKQEAERNRKRWGFPGLGIVVFPRSENTNEWLNEPMGKLKDAILEQTRAPNVDCPLPAPHVSLADFLKQIAARFNHPRGIGQLYLVLDQFQGWLNQDDDGVEKDEFLRGLARVINTPEVPVHFLVALQSSELGKLQRLEGLIRRLWGYRYELKHLDKEAARQAILKPLDVFCDGWRDEARVILEPLDQQDTFEELLLIDLRNESQGASAPSSEWKIEPSYLQLVMQRLWQKEGIPKKSHVIRWKTYESLKRTQGIIQEHVDQTMAQLDQAERDAVARSLRQLLLFAKPVRIDELVAHAKVAKKDWQPDLGKEQVQRLFDGPLVHDRILRPLADGEYECFLPTLGKPLGDWVCRQQRLDGLAEELSSAEAMFKRSQLDGLRQAEEAVSFVLQEVQRHNVSAGEVPTPLLIRSLRTMLDEVAEFRRITDPDSPLNSMSYSPDGKWFAAASLYGRVHLLNRKNGEERTIEDRDGAVLNVALGPGECIAIASGHGYARILYFDGNPPKQFPESPPQERSPCYCVAFSVDGKRLATGSLDGVARIWDIDRGECIECRGHQLTIHVVAFSPTEPILLTISWDTTARLWNADTGNPICVYQVEGNFIYQGDFSRRGDRVATVCWRGGLAHIWNIGDKKPLHEFQIQNQHLTHISFVDPEGRRVATASWDGIARTWDVEESSVTKKETRHLVPGPMFSACFSPDGRELATNPWDGAVHLWNLVKSQQAKGQEESKFVVETPGEAIMSARFSQSGDQFALAGFDKKIRLYSLRADPLDKSGVKLDLVFEKDSPHKGPLTCVAFGPSQTSGLATASYDGTGRLWFLDGDRLEEGPCLKGHQAQIYEITLSPREQVVATASLDGSVRFWNLSGKETAHFAGVGIVYSAKFHPKENLIASAWGDGSVRLIDIFGKNIGEYRPPGSSSPAFCVDFSDDGRFLGAVFGNGYACVWECCDDRPDRWLASEPRRPPFPVHEGLAMGIAFSPSPPASEPWFATSSGDGLIRLWSLNGRKLAEFKQHEDIVRAIDFNPDPTSLQLLTASVDGTAKLLKIDHGIESLQDLHRQARNWLGDRSAEETVADGNLPLVATS